MAIFKKKEKVKSENVRYCKKCKRELPKNYKYEDCDECRRESLINITKVAGAGAGSLGAGMMVISLLKKIIGK